MNNNLALSTSDIVLFTDRVDDVVNVMVLARVTSVTQNYVSVEEIMFVKVFTITRSTILYPIDYLVNFNLLGALKRNIGNISEVIRNITNIIQSI